MDEHQAQEILPRIGIPNRVTKLRIPRACEQCRSRKIKCNGEQPCKPCWKQHQSCIYRTGGIRDRKKMPKKQSTSNIRPKSLTQHAAIGNRTPRDQSRASHVNLTNDLGLQRQQQELRAGIGISNPKTGAFQFFGPSSHFCLIQRIYHRIRRSTQDTLLSEKNHPAPNELEKWGLERLLFSVDGENDPLSRKIPEAFMARTTGDMLLSAYFKIMHPQIPVLVHSEIMQIWNALWQSPSSNRNLRGKELVYMALAIGARVLNTSRRGDTAWIDDWADYFCSRANESSMILQEASLKGTHFMLLKAMYALQVMRPNDAYLFLGYATRALFALGMNRCQVTDGRNLSMHRLRLTFWTILANESISALFMGRPSALSMDHIDTPLPQDLQALDFITEIGDLEHSRPSTECAWVRAMAEIGKVAHKISTVIYSPASINSILRLMKTEEVIAECDTGLQNSVQSLPYYLQFYDNTLKVGDDWQEVQRINLGLNYYMVRMLLYRPAMVSANLLDSRSSLEGNEIPMTDTQAYINASTSAAKSLIDLAHNVYFKRFPDIRIDGAMASFLVSACTTLLCDVLHPGIDSHRAKLTFAAVERGIECLDEIDHVGPTTGKAISMDILKVARDTWMSAEAPTSLESELLQSIPQLQCV
ncbi:uncharacterized protein N7511_006672 [Penicillium nucicola]|uniref:uncharacterized protein n=1 Tax=Penicillium nucicola TaxID=1850975 RepID=UPI002545253D|nr:uncharacterized protein N7511_006672 [Penicillium nucicola]KAJ5757978.1 hypothetical protein N7511_006672 [Penicillium nucicola]